ncbi:MAG: fucose isomerase [Opitutales bacterium]|nr:fucose isomerase [Opitutales bacterium]
MAKNKKKSAARKKAAKNKKILLVSNGDLRLSANQVCWPNQAETEEKLKIVLADFGYDLVRAHPYKEDEGHGFIGSQKEGMEVFSKIDPDTPLIVFETVWQYSHHILHGLISHRGPILTLANWSGTWPGLVGMLNLNGSLTKAGVKYSSLWSENFDDPFFLNGLKKWLRSGKVSHPTAHTKKFRNAKVPGKARKVADKIATDLQRRKSIMGVFDEGCMGMFNAIIPDELLFPLGVYKERLSQSALYYAMTQVTNKEAEEVYKWIRNKGVKFRFGRDGTKDLAKAQVLEQCKMYIAVLRIAEEFGCETVGIQYQQGLKDLAPASDLVEGLLNNSERPPVTGTDGAVIRKGQPLTHFNEVDECAGLDGLFTNRVHSALKQPVENTLHDLRWGDWDQSGTTDEYVWVFLISGSAPPAHFINGFKGASSERQPPMYFRLGGGTLKGISKPGEIVWSRVYVANGKLKMDIGRAGVVELPKKETERRWKETTPQWPIMHAVTYGVSRDQMMTKHQSNHIQVAYAENAAKADLAAYTKAALAEKLGLEVTFCGKKKNGKPF